MTISIYGRSRREVSSALKTVGAVILGVSVFTGVNLPTPAQAQWQLLLGEGLAARVAVGAAARGLVAAESRVVAGAVVARGGQTIVRNPRFYAYNFAPRISMPPMHSYGPVSGGYYPQPQPNYQARRCVTGTQMLVVNGNLVQRTYWRSC